VPPYPPKARRRILNDAALLRPAASIKRCDMRLGNNGRPMGRVLVRVESSAQAGLAGEKRWRRRREGGKGTRRGRFSWPFLPETRDEITAIRSSSPARRILAAAAARAKRATHTQVSDYS